MRGTRSETSSSGVAISCSDRSVGRRSPTTSIEAGPPTDPNTRWRPPKTTFRSRVPRMERELMRRKGRRARRGGVQADLATVVVNPHKWLLVPMDCSTLWTRRPEDFRRAFSLVPEYLRNDAETANLSELAIPLGRRFRALKLWAVLRCYGRSGLQEMIRESIRLAALFEEWVEAEPRWEVVAPRPLLVCFRHDGTDDENEAIMRRVNTSGEAFLAHEARRPTRAAAGGRERAHHRGRHPGHVGRAAARGRAALATGRCRPCRRRSSRRWCGGRSRSDPRRRAMHRQRRCPRPW